MPVTNFDLVNRALALLGAKPIVDFTTMPNGPTAQTLYPLVEDRLVVSHPWRFLMTKVELADSASVPLNEWTTSHDLPSDIEGGPWAVFNTTSAGARPITDYEIFEGAIFSDEAALWIDYRIQKGEDTWPPYFQALMTYALAAHLAEIVSEETSKAEHWYQVAFGPLNGDGMGGYSQTARRLDSQQQPPGRIGDFALIEARAGG